MAKIFGCEIDTMLVAEGVFARIVKVEYGTVLVVGTSVTDVAEKVEEIEAEQTARLLGYFDAEQMNKFNEECAWREQKDWEDAAEYAAEIAALEKREDILIDRLKEEGA